MQAALPRSFLYISRALPSQLSFLSLCKIFIYPPASKFLQDSPRVTEMIFWPEHSRPTTHVSREPDSIVLILLDIACQTLHTRTPSSDSVLSNKHNNKCINSSCIVLGMIFKLIRHSDKVQLGGLWQIRGSEISSWDFVSLAVHKHKRMSTICQYYTQGCKVLQRHSDRNNRQDIQMVPKVG